MKEAGTAMVEGTRYTLKAILVSAATAAFFSCGCVAVRCRGGQRREEGRGQGARAGSYTCVTVPVATRCLHRVLLRFALYLAGFCFFSFRLCSFY